jgi:hypothetical protein
VHIDLSSLRQLENEQWETLCHYLLPSGHKEGHRWIVGSIDGEPGHSFDVNLRTGLFGDWATGERPQSGAIDLWMAVRKVDLGTAVRELTAWLGRTTSITNHQKHPAPYPLTSPPKKNRIYLPKGLSLPTKHDLQVLSKSRAIDFEALRIARERGFIYCFNDPFNGRCWLYTDSRRKCALRRRLDNSLWQFQDGRSTKSAICSASDMRSPLGYQEARAYPCFGVIEGAPDALALLAYAWADGLQERVAPVCMPSQKTNFSESVLGYLQGKRARIFIDNDAPGWEAAARWAAQLAKANITVDEFSFGNLVMTDGHPVKDLNDTLRIDYDCWERSRNRLDSIMDFASL